MSVKRRSRVRKAESDSIYELKVTLSGINPPIWRCLHVVSNVALGEPVVQETAWNPINRKEARVI